MEYKYIWAWHRLSGSFDYYIINLVNKAKADGAPETAIFYDTWEKRWVTVEEVQNERRVKDMENWIAAPRWALSTAWTASGQSERCTEWKTTQRR